MSLVISHKAIRNGSKFLYEEKFAHDTIGKIRKSLIKNDANLSEKDLKEIAQQYYNLFHEQELYLKLFFISRNDNLETFLNMFVIDPDGYTEIKID